MRIYDHCAELQQLKTRPRLCLEAARHRFVEAGILRALGPNGAGKSTTIGIISLLVNKRPGALTLWLRPERRINAKRQPDWCHRVNLNLFETVQQIVVNQAGYYGVEHSGLRSEKYETARFVENQ